MADVIPLILAAGASTRMKSSRSKLLMDLMGRSTIERAILQADQLGAQAPVIVLGHQREEIEKILKERFPKKNFRFALQDPPRGTGDAVRLAVEKMTEKEATVFIMGADAVLLRPESLREFLKEHEKKRAVLSLMTAELHNPAAYGRVVRNRGSGAVEKIVELKEASEEEILIREINAGFYLVSLTVLRDFISSLSKNEKIGEFLLTDLVSYVAHRQQLIHAHRLYDFTECLGFNTQAELSLARRVIRDRIVEKHMIAGVEILDPTTVWISEDVEFGKDVKIGTNVQITGSTKIGDSVTIESHTIIDNCEIGPRCRIGPFARLRPGAQLVEDVKIGNFVEVKKSKFQSGSKASHLSYIGDTNVGKNSNIGAGTITCNYDGYAKSKTEIEDEVFIGSNSSLVAPVKISKGSIVGAGSVITENVSENAMALARAEQKEIKDGAEKFRKKRGKK